MYFPPRFPTILYFLEEHPWTKGQIQLAFSRDRCMYSQALEKTQALTILREASEMAIFCASYATRAKISIF